MKRFSIPLVALALAGLAVGSASFAEEKKSEVKKPEENTDIRKLLCHGPHEERSLEIVNSGKGCKLEYTKQKETSIMAHAQNSVEPCKAALQKIRARLEAGNFACE